MPPVAAEALTCAARAKRSSEATEDALSVPTDMIAFVATETEISSVTAGALFCRIPSLATDGASS